MRRGFRRENRRLLDHPQGFTPERRLPFPLQLHFSCQYAGFRGHTNALNEYLGNLDHSVGFHRLKRLPTHCISTWNSKYLREGLRWGRYARSVYAVEPHYNTQPGQRKEGWGNGNPTLPSAPGGSRTRTPVKGTCPSSTPVCQFQHRRLALVHYSRGLNGVKKRMRRTRRFVCSNKDAHRATENTEYSLEQIKILSVFSVPP